MTAGGVLSVDVEELRADAYLSLVRRSVQIGQQGANGVPVEAIDAVLEPAHPNWLNYSRRELAVHLAAESAVVADLALRLHHARLLVEESGPVAAEVLAGLDRVRVLVDRLAAVSPGRPGDE